MARKQFFEALDAYKLALESGTSADVVRTSMIVYFARVNVPKNLHSLINRTYRAARPRPAA